MWVFSRKIHIPTLNLATKVTVLVCSMVLVATISLELWTSSTFSATLNEHALHQLDENANVASIRFASFIQELTQDAAFLSGTPPIQGVIRAIKTEDQLDPIDGSSLIQWRARMAMIMKQMLNAKSHYYQIAYLSVDDNWREIVRVNREDNKNATLTIEHEPHSGHMNLSSSYKQIIQMPAGQVHLSDIELACDHGQIKTPHIPTIRASIPILDQGGNPFGILVIHRNLDSHIKAIAKNIPPGRSLYVTNDRGDYLVHPDISRTFGFQLGQSYQLQDEFPELGNNLKSTNHHKNTIMQNNLTGQRIAASFRKISFDPHNSDRFFGCIVSAPYEQITAEVASIRSEMHIVTFVFVIFALAASLLFANSVTKPLRQITLVAQSFADESSNENLAESLPLDAKDETGTLARSFNTMIQQVNDRTRRLKDEIIQRRKAEVENETMQRDLMDASRRAGMSEVATGVLHNVGNALNSVNVSANLLSEKVGASRVLSLLNVTELINEHAHDLGHFMTEDDRGKRLPQYLHQLVEHLASEQVMMAEELASLNGHIEHIRETVSMQQSYASVSGVTETLSVIEMMDDALQINNVSLLKHGVNIVQDYHEVPDINTSKHKVLQILVNLISNAKSALTECNGDNCDINKTMTLKIQSNDEDQVQIQVIDSGVGIKSENMDKIFQHGFTTKDNGHGFGLHSSALAAEGLGGSLSVHSEGLGSGATFTLIFVNI